MDGCSTSRREMDYHLIVLVSLTDHPWRISFDGMNDTFFVHFIRWWRSILVIWSSTWMRRWFDKSKDRNEFGEWKEWVFVELTLVRAWRTASLHVSPLWQTYFIFPPSSSRKERLHVHYHRSSFTHLRWVMFGVHTRRRVGPHQKRWLIISTTSSVHTVTMNRVC